MTIDAQGTTIQIDDATPGTADVAIGKVKSFSGFDGESSEIDQTHLGSTAKEKRLGLQDFGSFSMEWQVDYADSGQDVCRAAQTSRAVKTFLVTYLDGTTATFNGLVKNAERVSGSVDSLVDGGASVAITGIVTFA